MTKKNRLKLFLNDLLLNSVCEKNDSYVENKRKEWKFLRQALKQHLSLI